MINNQEKFHACSTIFVGLDTFLGKESESKTHAEKKKYIVCMHRNAGI
jgi:hypothetical protein